MTVIPSSVIKTIIYNKLKPISKSEYLLCFLYKQTVINIISIGNSFHFFFFFFNFILFWNFTILYWFCQTSKWIRHRYICVPHPEPSSLLPPHTIPLGHPSAQPQASSIVHRTWTGDSFHIWYYTYFNAILPNHPTLSLSYRVQKTVLKKNL